MRVRQAGLLGLTLVTAACASHAPPADAPHAALARSRGHAAVPPPPDDPRHAQYYDKRRRRYFYYDPDKRTYFWSNGEPKG